jgi:hypothetical protein
MANGIGVTYVLFALADRLDTTTHPPGWVAGVPRIVERYC